MKFINYSFLMILSLFAVGLKAQVKADFIIQAGHSDYIHGISISPDNKYILSASKDKTLKLWDIASGKEIRDYYGHESEVTSVCFSSNGNYALSGSTDKTIKLWDVLSGNELKTYTGSTKDVVSVSFSPDETKILSGSKDYIMRIFDRETGEIIKSYQGKEYEYSTVAYLPNGNQAIVISNIKNVSHCLKIIDLATGYVVKTFKGDKEFLISMAISKDGRYVAAGSYDRKLRVWDVNSGSLIKTFIGHKEWIYAISFSDNMKYIASAGSQGEMKLWDFESGNVLNDLNGHQNVIKALKFLNGDSRVVSAAWDNTIKIWLTNNGALEKDLKGVTENINVVNFIGNTYNIVSGGNDKSVKQWDIANIGFTGNFYEPNNEGRIYSLDVSPDGKRLLTGDTKDKMKLWDIETGELIKTFTEHKHYVEAVCFSSDGKKALSASRDDFIRYWNLEDYSLIRAVKNINQLGIFSLSFLPDNTRYITGSWDANMRLWDVNYSTPLKTLTTHHSIPGLLMTDIINAIAVSPDGVMAASASHDRTVKVYDLINNQIRHTLTGHNSAVWDVCFSPDSKKIVTASGDRTLKLWNAETGAEIRTFVGHSHSVKSVVFSHDGKYIASGGSDNTLKIWESETGKLLYSAIVNADGTEWLIYTPDGYWDASPNGGKLVAMVNGYDVWNIDQFAAKYNRPDKILRNMPFANPKLIAHYEAQYKKRLRKLKISEQQLANDKHVPEAKIASFAKEGDFVSLNLELADTKYALTRYNIFINDVPLHGSSGKVITGNNIKINEKCELNNGINKIEVSCTNAQAVESYRDVISITNEKNQNPDLYLLAFGVSTYQNPSLNLQYAHKDALDLEEALQSLKGKGFENVYTKTLVNEQVTTANIKAAKDFVKNARPDDIFILFIAGHGMHDTDSEATYYYLTHNAVLKNLKGTAATFETIEDLLQGIPPRNKLFFMDACESGELDPEDEVQFLASATQAGVNSRGFKKANNVIASAAKQPVQNRSYLLNRNRYIYNDLVRRSGAIVFSSSKGGELSYERSDIENGLFTEYIMKALTTIEADKDNNGIASTDEIREYVSAQVAKASGNLQHPTVDRDNIYQKFGFKVK